MDAPEPETPFGAVSAQTSKYGRVSEYEDPGTRNPRSRMPCGGFTVRSADGSVVQIYQAYLDKCVPYTTYRWIATGVIFVLFCLRIVLAQGWYIGA